MKVYFNNSFTNRKPNWLSFDKILLWSVVFFDGKKIFFDDKFLSYLNKNLSFLNFKLDLNENLFCNLMKINDLQDEAVLFKIYLVFENKIKPLIIPQVVSVSKQPLKLIVHKEIKPSRDGNCCLKPIMDNEFWNFYYKNKNFDGFICLNHKSRLFTSNLGDLFVVRKKLLYLVNKREKYFPRSPVIHFLTKKVEQLGFKKVLEKNNGLSENLISQADEVYVLGATGFRPVKEIHWGKNVYSFRKNEFFEVLNKKFSRYGKKILCDLERA